MIDFYADGVGFRVEGVTELKQLIEEGMIEDVINIFLTVLEVSKTAEDLSEINDIFGFTLEEGEDDKK